ncbi:MAG TPA: glycosyltransferase family 2 protein [Bryobacteraceae bacterium]|jgi:GT2 family glycosyltransferase|nr:glycosyltransferase family 2 protein [Bryobacteraceae bacterium]
MLTVSAVIPTWNRADLVESVLANLSQQTHPPDKILVVDNGSTDGTRSVVAQAGAEFIGLPTNQGFASAVNEGIRRSETDWILILNNDVVLPPNWLELLLAAARATEASFAVGKLLRGGTSQAANATKALLDGSWDLCSRGGYAWRCGYERPDGAVWANRRAIALAPMTAALFQKRIFAAIGLLETRFESYYEDVDFGIRCALAGFVGVYEPAAAAVHLGKATYGKRAARVYFLSARNQVLLLAKHYPPGTLRRFAWPIFVGQLLSVLAAAKQGQVLPALHGKWQGFRLWSLFRNELPNEASIEKTMTANEQEILQIQRSIGFDIYWRLYFSLVHPA